MKYLVITVILLLSACSPQIQPVSNTQEVDLQLNGTDQPSPDLESGESQLNLPTEPEELGNQKSSNETMSEKELVSAEEVILKTSKGDIRLKLYPEVAPITVDNFVTKANQGYYDGLTFHRVVDDFVIQGGDPLGTGTGGGDIPTELSEVPFTVGSLGVARASDINVSNDSQFFICTSDSCAQLTGKYTNFGEVLEGQEIAESIEIGDTITEIEVVK